MKIPFPNLAQFVKKKKLTYGFMNRSIIYRLENILVCKLHTTTIMIAIVCVPVFFSKINLNAKL